MKIQIEMTEIEGQTALTILSTIVSHSMAMQARVLADALKDEQAVAWSFTHPISPSSDTLKDMADILKNGPVEGPCSAPAPANE